MQSQIRQSILSALKNIHAGYPELKEAYTASGWSGRMTKGGYPSLTQPTAVLEKALDFARAYADTTRLAIPSAVNDAINGGVLSGSIPFALDKRLTQQELFDTLRLIERRVTDGDGRRVAGITLTFVNGRAGTWFNLGTLEELTRRGSDENYGDDGAQVTAIDNNKFRLIIASRPIGIEARASRSGAYFRYYSPHLDLTRYGIFRSREDADYGDACLVHALKTAGMPESKLNLARKIILSRDFPTSQLSNLCDALGIKIKLHSPHSAAGGAGSHKVVRTYGGSGAEYEIALLENHYFVFDRETPFTKTFALNIDEVMTQAERESVDLQTLGQVTRQNRGKTRWVQRDSVERALCDSWHLVACALKSQRALVKIPIKDVLETTNLSHHHRNLEDLDYELEDPVPPKMVDGRLCSDPNAIVYKRRMVNMFSRIAFADFEASTRLNDKKLLPAHQPFALGWTYGGQTKVEIHEDAGKLFGMFIDDLIEGAKPALIPNGSKPPIESFKHLIYFHNLRYDISLFVNEVSVKNLLEKDGQVYELVFQHGPWEISVRDTHKLVSMPLSAFPEMFGLPIEKEAFPYDFYTRERVVAGLIPTTITKAKRYIPADKQTAFDEALEGLGMKKRFDPAAFAKHYCARDVDVLAAGMKRFREMIEEAFGLDAFAYRTISSLSYEYQIKMGCFKECFLLNGVLNHFVSQSVIGGQCQIADNQPHEVTVPTCDFDMTSCYPSAQASIKGYPTGRGKVIRDIENFDLGCDKPYYVEIELTDHHYDGVKNDKRRRHPFPSLCEKIGGVTTYDNAPTKRRFVVSQVQLRDHARHYGWERGIHFIVKRGIMFDGWNPRIGTVIAQMFEKRRELKKCGNRLEQVYKLMLNSSYGKTIVKPSDRGTIILPKSDQAAIDSYIVNNASRILYATETTTQWIFSVRKSLAKHFSSPHAGSLILAQAKWLMHNVFLYAHENEIPIHYSDTDSMIIERKDLPRLSHFEGKALGKFHTDLASSSIKSQVKAAGEEYDEAQLYAGHARFISKKLYHLDLRYDLPSGQTVRDQYSHARAKGIPNSVLRATAEKMGKDLGDLYGDCLSGGEIEFDMLCSGRPAFRYDRGMAVRSIEIFTRKMKPAPSPAPRDPEKK